MPTITNAHRPSVVTSRPVAPAGEAVRTIEPHEFRDAIKTGKVVVEFFNYGCPYCRAAAPELERVAREKLGDVTFVKMSLGHPLAQALAGQFGTTLLPGFALFDEGSFIGAFGRQGRDHVKADFIKANVDYAFHL